MVWAACVHGEHVDWNDIDVRPPQVAVTEMVHGNGRPGVQLEKIPTVRDPGLFSRLSAGGLERAFPLLCAAGDPLPVPAGSLRPSE